MATEMINFGLSFLDYGFLSALINCLDAALIYGVMLGFIAAYFTEKNTDKKIVEDVLDQ